MKRNPSKNVEIVEDAVFVGIGSPRPSKWGGYFITVKYKSKTYGRINIHVYGKMDNFEDWETFLINNQDDYASYWRVAIMRDKETGELLRHKGSNAYQGHGDHIPQLIPHRMDSTTQFNKLFA